MARSPDYTTLVTQLPTVCETKTTESECTAAGCYWWGNACHSEPQSWWDKYKYYIIAGGAVAIVAGIVIASR